MDYKTVLQEQIRELQKVQDENILSTIINIEAKTDNACKLALIILQISLAAKDM